MTKAGATGASLKASACPEVPANKGWHTQQTQQTHLLLLAMGNDIGDQVERAQVLKRILYYKLIKIRLLRLLRMPCP
jgi:hypothetical protein